MAAPKSIMTTSKAAVESCPQRRPTTRSSVPLGLRLTPNDTAITSPKSIMSARHEVDSAAAISVQVELLSRAPEQAVSAAVRLTEMVERDRAALEEIRTAGGVRSAVFLLKLSQMAGHQRIANATSRLLLYLTRDCPRNQDEIRTLGGIPCLLDVVLSIARLGESRYASDRELLEKTEAVRWAAMTLGLLADRHAHAIARVGAVDVSVRDDGTPSLLPLIGELAPDTLLGTELSLSFSRRSSSRCSAGATEKALRWRLRTRCPALRVATGGLWKRAGRRTMSRRVLVETAWRSLFCWNDVG